MTRVKSRASVADEIATLTNLGLAELRSFWTSRYGAPPKQRSAALIKQLLAWRMQADVYGGLDIATVRLLANERAPMMAAQKSGTRLARDYAGRRHEVVVMDKGIFYDGKHYGSLSEVARLITGQRWNGPRFFGLRRDVVQ